MHQQKKEDSRPWNVWVITLGYNHAEDSLECLKSLSQSERVAFTLLFTDNQSADDSVARVLAELPHVRVVETGENVGFARGFNAGMEYACSQGADAVFMINNDTVVAPDCLACLLKEALAHPEAGILVPKIYYYDDPKVIWSAGSRFRRFPPALVMRKTREEDRGQLDGERELAYATTCALLVTRPFLEKTGLLDRDYFIMYDDYDWSIRARENGFSIRFVPEAHMWHKVSKSTGVGTRNPFFWMHYGKSSAIFFRKHARYRWLTGPVHHLYLLARMLVEGTAFGVRPFLKGWWEGKKTELHPPPHPGRGETDAFTVVRG
jgi:GT2 family glycosyltransferase